MEILIRDVDEQLSAMLDDIVRAEKYASRSVLINEILSLYVTSHHKFFTRALTPTVKFLTQEVLQEQSEYTQRSLNLIYNISSDLLKKMDELHAVFLPGLPREATENTATKPLPNTESQVLP